MSPSRNSTKWVENLLNENHSQTGGREKRQKKAVFTSCETASIISVIVSKAKQSV